MLEKIKKICFNIATLGGIGEFIFGGIAATLLAIPVLLLLNTLMWFGPMFLSIAAVILTLAVIITIHLALRFESDKDASSIVLDRFFGFIVMLLGIPLGFKIVVVGLIFFSVLNFFSSFLFNKLLKFNFDELPGALGILTGDIVMGLFLNVFFRFVLWLAR